MAVQKTATIFEESDYSKFKLIESNRDISREHAVKIVKSLETVNLMEDHPILVDQNMNVLDGQHRLEACKMLGIPVWYKISTKMQIKDIPITNSIVKPWRADDYLKQYCSLEFDSYLKLRHFMDTTALKIKAALSLMRNGSIGKAYSSFYNGCFVYPENDTRYWDFMKKLDDFEGIGLRFSPHTTAFVIAYWHAYCVKGFSHRQMMTKMKYKTGSLTCTNKWKEYMPMIEAIYNTGAQKASRIALRLTYGIEDDED
jgi:hypothetical protein